MKRLTHSTRKKDQLVVREKFAREAIERTTDVLGEPGTGTSKVKVYATYLATYTTVPLSIGERSSERARRRCAAAAHTPSQGPPSPAPR
eukprot:scaffold40105_cov54-Phaeocystis_antarctica.AAC.1